ncbi:MAG: HEPN domain-containing protein [Bacteroidota bacterium]
MKPEDRSQYVAYRLEKAEEVFQVVELLVENEKWNSAINRLYYAAYYAVSALLVHSQIPTKTHSGVKTQFFLHFIKSQKLEYTFAKTYADLFDWRQKGDYGDFFDFTSEDVLPMLDPVRNLIDALKSEIYS